MIDAHFPGGKVGKCSLGEPVDLTGNPGPDPDAGSLAEVLREVTTGLIRERLGLAGGFTPATRCLLYQEWVRLVIGRRSGDLELNPAKIVLSPAFLWPRAFSTRPLS
jgi:hypothetical protein